MGIGQKSVKMKCIRQVISQKAIEEQTIVADSSEKFRIIKFVLLSKSCSQRLIVKIIEPLPSPRICRTMTVTVQNLRDALHSAEVEELWEICLEAYHQDNTSQQDHIDLAKWISSVRTNFLAHAEDVGDEDSDELRTSLALGYIEMKSRWQMLNTQINYQVFRKGEANITLTYKSTLLSILVDKIGGFITAQDLQKIQEFLLNPTIMTL
jgi:hypothetical protein